MPRPPATGTKLAHLRITPEIGQELLTMDSTGATSAMMCRHLFTAHGIRMSPATLNRWRADQRDIKSIASLRAISPRIELVMSNEVDELLKFKDFCFNTFVEVWKRLPDTEKYNQKTALKFLDAYQKAQAQVMVLHGLEAAARAGQTLDDATAALNEKLARYVTATNTAIDATFTPDTTDEDMEPQGDE